MKIAFFSSRSPFDYPGGAEVLTGIIATELAQQGHEVRIYTGQQVSVQNKQVSTIVLPELRLIPFRTVLSPIRSMVLSLKLSRDTFLAQAQVIHAVDMDSILLLAPIAMIRKKLIVTIQDYGLLMENETSTLSVHSQYLQKHINHYILWVRRFFHLRTMRFLHTAICVSRYIRNQVNKQAPWITTYVIGNCVSDDWFTVPIVPKDIDLLYVGRMEEYKGVAMLDMALPFIRKQIPKIKTVLIGSGSYQIRKQPNITIIPHVDHHMINTYFHRARIVAVPSLWQEPCGRTIIEAMASGVPVIATRVGGSPEAFVHKKHGILINVDVQAFVQAVVWLLQHKQAAKTYGIRARRYAKCAYSVRWICREYLACYQRLYKYDAFV